MTYMAVGNTRDDYSMVAQYITDIDFSSIGLPETDLNAILALAPQDEPIEVETFDINEFATHKKDDDEKGETYTELDNLIEIDDEQAYQDNKQAVIEAKKRVQEKAMEDGQNEEAYITISFSTFRDKAILCELLGLNEDAKFCKGEDVLRLVE